MNDTTQNNKAQADDKGITALAINQLLTNNQTPQTLDTILQIAGSLPNDKVAQTATTLKAVQQGSMLGVGMALASATPGSDFSEAMNKINALSSAISAINQGSIMGTGMALAGLDPNSQFANTMGQIAQAKNLLDQGLAILKPQINPADLMMNINSRQQTTPAPPTQSTTPSSQNATPSGTDGAFIKGEGLKCPPCALSNQQAMIGAPVQALYGSKILAGGDDIDFTGKGYLPFVMSRIYNNQNPNIGWFGQGWSSQGFEQRLELDPQHNRIYLIDNTGRRVPFTYLAPNQNCYQPTEGITLYRKPLPENKTHKPTTNQPILADASNNTRISDDEPLEFIIYMGNYNPKNKPTDSFTGISQHYNTVINRDRHGTTATVLLSRYCDKYGHSIQLHYTRSNNTAHLPEYITDDTGNCYQLEFSNINNHHRLTALYDIKDSNNKTALAQYHYSHEGDLIKVDTHGQTQRQFAYQNHLMIEQTQANGQQATYQYDQYDNPKTARVIKQQLSNGRHYQFTYDRDDTGQGITTVIEQANSELERTRRFECDQWYNMTSLTDPNGNTTHYQYDDNNRTTKIIHPNGSHSNLNYQNHLLESVEIQTNINPITKLPTYRTTHYQYNQIGQLTAITDALGNSTYFAYNPKGELITQTDANGKQTHYQYDEHGNLIRQTLASGSHFAYQYDQHGNLTCQSDCSGYQTHYHYDDKQRLRQIINAKGQSTQYHYNHANPNLEHLITHVTYPDATHTSMEYDQQGRLTSYTDAQGQQIHYQYGENGQPSKRTQSEQQTNNSITRINQTGHALSYSYDILGRLTRLTNENGEHWNFVYDKADNLISETRFDGSTSHYRYNQIGQLIHQINNPHLPRYQQQHTYLEYNLAGELITQHSSHYPELIHLHNTPRKAIQPQYQRTHYQYDDTGRLISASNPHSRINFSYNNIGQLTEETLISQLTQANQHAHTLTLQHHYDEIGNRTKTILPDGKILNQLYYGSGHLYNQSLQDPSNQGQGNITEIRHSEKNELHQEITRQQGTLTSAYGYDPMGRLIKQYSSTDKHITIERHYHYDKLGQLTHLTGQSLLDSKHNTHYQRGHQYQYDKIGRLTEHKLSDYQNHTGITEVFAFDPASNRIAIHHKQNNNEQQLATQGRPSELIHNGKRIRYTYDSHGRVLYKTTQPVDNNSNQPKQSLQLQYNAGGEIEQSLTAIYQHNQVSKIHTKYHYDAFGRRIGKHSQIKHFVQHNGQLKQTQRTQHKCIHFLWSGDRQLQEYTDTHVFTTVYEQDSFVPVARLIWANDDKDNTIKLYHYHNNHLGTPQELTDQNGEVIWLSYDMAWGGQFDGYYKPQKINDYDIDKHELQPLRFQGQYLDTETGLHYNRFRYYDCDVGMFVSRDPIGLLGGNNVFQYAPNPVMWVDPLGLSACTDCDEIKPCGNNNPYTYDTPQYWIQEWVGSSDNWVSAHSTAYSGKMNPGTDAQTAAEHYIFMRGVQTAPDSQIFGSQMTMWGGVATPIYQATKLLLHKSLKTSKPSMQQLEWGERGWHDGIRDVHGFMYDPAHAQYYSVTTRSGECK